MNKPTKPTDLMPRSFGGVKANWSAAMQSSGYEAGVPTIYGGDNLNYQLDATGKELDYCETICDYINALPIGKTITTDSSNKLVYTDVSDSNKANISLDNLNTDGIKKVLPSQNGNSGKYLTTDGTSPSWTEFTGANQSLSNLNADGVAFVNNSKALETGTSSNNQTIYNDIYNYNHSTFDKSKFIIEGTPTITDDGIISGFTTDDYLTKTVNLDGTKTFEILFKFKTPSVINADGAIIAKTSSPCINYRLNSAKKVFCEFSISSSTRHYNTSTATLEENTEYYGKISYDKSKVYFYASEDNITFTNLVEFSNISDFTGIEEFILGVGRSPGSSYYATPFQGSIDLKLFSVFVDGVPIFNGNDGGIDTIKPNNYTVVGTPTISNNGIVRGFSASNYLTATITSLTLDKINIFGSFSTDSLLTGSKEIIAIADSSSLSDTILQIILDGNNSKIGIGCHNDTTWTGYYSANNTIASNTNYYYHVYYKDGNIKLDLSTDNITYTNVVNNAITVNSSYSSTQVYFGSIADANYFTGSIDLNAFKIYLDGDLVYQPCLKIPYTLSKTGSKVADVAYRDRVSDMYEQFGYAPYYIIDETNKNFTLPMGEIYGMINKKLDADLGNIQSDEKKTIVGWGLPDYTNAVGVSPSTVTPYKATKKGYIIIQSVILDNSDCKISVNGTQVFYVHKPSAGSLRFGGTIFPVDVGDIVSFSGSTPTVYFAAMKGL